MKLLELEQLFIIGYKVRTTYVGCRQQLQVVLVVGGWSSQGLDSIWGGDRRNREPLLESSQAFVRNAVLVYVNQNMNREDRDC